MRSIKTTVGAKMQQVSDSTFQTEVLNSSVPVLVDFWAEWCAPCRALAPTLDELATQYQGRVKIVKINVDENPDVPTQFNVRGIPTLILFKNGIVVDQSTGNVPKTQLVTLIEKGL